MCNSAIHRAIDEITRFADDLKQSSTIGGEWDGSESAAREEYDRLMAIVDDLAAFNVPLSNEVNKTTPRGFHYVAFTDYYGERCSIQKSSIATEDCIWLGIDEPKPIVMARELRPDLTGWVPLPMPEGVHIPGRMHLTIEQVANLLPILQRFVDTGEIREVQS